MELSFADIINWGNGLYFLLGLAWGSLFAFIPGLNVTMALVTLMPLLIKIPPTAAMMVMGAAIGGGPFFGSVPAILFNIPGTSQNLATPFDGYPMAKQGHAGRALAIAATASLVGAVFGLILLVAIMGFARQVFTLFSSPEVFLLVLLGLSTLAVISRGDIIKGIAAGLFGIMVGLVGFHNATGTIRFTFGIAPLWDGIDVLPVFIGIFAIGEMAMLATQGGSIGGGRRFSTTWRDTIEGIKDPFRHPVCLIRSAIIGWVIGVIPGIGPTTANVLSYGVAVQSSKHPQTFGTGEIEGVIAAETANNGTQGGGLVTTFGLGIPGTMGDVLIIAVLMLLGIQPGPLMVREHMDVIAATFVAVLLANVLASTIGLAIASRLAWFTSVKNNLIIPAVIAMSLAGAYMADKSILDVAVALVFGLLGFGMQKYGFPRAPFIIGFVLGPIAEQSFTTSWAMGYGSPVLFFTRPIAATIIGLLVLLYLINPIRNYITRRRIKAQKLPGTA